ncbi:MAG: hypothetical protein HON68_00870 [Gammaproteobacteria bacterium]|jgi:hypothetical protein|nr:hypothetical protein [Gammaproteobacteria bacterium]MBT3489467.1 hypothetical protein [Gammaproteobacteria bacterium]MBT3718629.1 hypothetical protein [Gammaproteobacteria bacterium]MBT3844776.1 hypothetical protein [Gammaproteobacteria bacterium]MBT3892813.1 hypothetical protein [Gammaproteobacteria bacterium]
MHQQSKNSPSRSYDRRTVQLLESADFMLSYAQVALQKKTQEQLKLYISQSIAILKILYKEECQEKRLRGKRQTLFYALISQLTVAYQERNLKQLNGVRRRIHEIVDC